jgi:hypothetical protein
MSLSRTALGFFLVGSSALGQGTIGVLSHIAAGGGWTTVITLVGSGRLVKGGVQLRFYDDNGSALSLPVTTTQQGRSQTTTTAVVSADLRMNETWLISIGDQVASTVVGWATVSSSVDGFAIFRYTPHSGPASEGTVPLQKVMTNTSSFTSTLTLPYDDTAGAVMGVALANPSTVPTTVTATIFDDNGLLLGTQNFRIAANGHTSFVMPSQILLTAGRRGLIQFETATIAGLAGLGLRFSPIGTFTSVPTL